MWRKLTYPTKSSLWQPNPPGKSVCHKYCRQNQHYHATASGPLMPGWTNVVSSIKSVCFQFVPISYAKVTTTGAATFNQLPQAQKIDRCISYLIPPISHLFKCHHPPHQLQLQLQPPHHHRTLRLQHHPWPTQPCSIIKWNWNIFPPKLRQNCASNPKTTKNWHPAMQRTRKVNINIAKQLNFLSKNTKKLLKYTSTVQTQSPPSPHGSDET